MSEPLLVQFSREEAFELARVWMVENYGIPKGMDSEQKDKWCERYGMLIHFLDDVFPKDGAGNGKGEE